MRSPEEIVTFCKDRIGQLGISQAEALRKAGCSNTLFIMMSQRKTYPKLETITSLAEALEVSEADILGLRNEPALVVKEYLPEDIQQIVKVLKEISPENRKIIAMNIKNYRKIEKQNKQ